MHLKDGEEKRNNLCPAPFDPPGPRFVVKKKKKNEEEEEEEEKELEENTRDARRVRLRSTASQ